MIDLVIVGLGYVGLPLAQRASQTGLTVRGFDINEHLVSQLNQGVSHIDDLSNSDIETMLSQGFAATTDPTIFRESEAIVICVPTPLSQEGGPDLGAVKGAANTIAPYIQPDQLIVLESTTYPGTTAELLTPLLEAGSGLSSLSDFHVAFSPERVDPGNQTYGIANTPKVVGADTERGGERAVELYERFIDTVVRAKGTREAEMTKLLENTYRHINIALVNEMAQFSHELGIDLWDVIRCASTKPFGFQTFTPGPGVGGHCIPIDPNYLSYNVRTTLGYPFRFVELAQEINHRMPHYVAERVSEILNNAPVPKPVRGSEVLLLGVTYKPNIADQRESPAVPLAQTLTQMGAIVRFHDPHVQTWHINGSSLERVEDLTASLQQSDLTILLQPHKSYDLDFLVTQAKLFFDTRGVTRHAWVERL